MGEGEGVLLVKISLLMLSGIHVDCWCYSFCIHTSIVSSILYYSRTTMSATEAWHNGRSVPATSFLWDLKAAQTSSSRSLLIISTKRQWAFQRLSSWVVNYLVQVLALPLVPPLLGQAADPVRSVFQL